MVHWNSKLWGFKLWIWLSLLTFYSFFGALYHEVIYLTTQGTSGWAPNTVIDYLLKAILTIPLWWLIFKKLEDWPLQRKIWIHLFGLPLWVIAWQQSYYLVVDYLGMGRLRGPGTWWDIYIPGLFYILQFGIFHVYDFYVKLKKQHELEKDLRHIALQSELTALKAQLNPHFLYNTFNTISASVPPELEKTREMIAALSDLFRYQLQASKVDRVTFEEELDFVKKYLELEKARFGQRLNITYDIQDGVGSIEIPPIILQPLVENAIRHGISPKIEGGDITISAFLRNKHLSISVCDTGVGLTGDWPNKMGVGLTNTQKRLEKIYQTELRFEHPEDGGLCVNFNIPVA